VLASWVPKLTDGDSYMFLSSIADPPAKVVGWNSLDTYEGCSRKYLDFIKNKSLVDSDWIVFVDDDTFVFPKRIRDMLETYDPTNELYIGKLLYGPIPTMSGGAGFCVSKALYAKLHSFVNTRNVILDHIYSDVTIAQWIQRIPTAIYVWDKRFNSHPHTEEGSIDTALTFHFVTEPLFRHYAQCL